jgi:hypothetical protein
VALVSLKTAAAQGDLRLGSADGPPLTLAAPPYPVPLEAA